MVKLVEVYPKIGCFTDGDPTGFQWGSGARQAVKARIQGIVDGFPGATVDSWHLHTDEGAVEYDLDSDRWTIRTPKAVVTLTVPNNTTHIQIVQAFMADGFWDWAKNGIRNRLPAGVTVLRWRGKLMTSLGRSIINQAGP